MPESWQLERRNRQDSEKLVRNGEVLADRDFCWISNEIVILADWLSDAMSWIVIQDSSKQLLA